MAVLSTRKLTISIGATEYAPSVSRAIISSAESESDFLSFTDAAGDGGRTYSLDLTFVQDPSASTIWDLIWTAAGTDVAVVVRPAGNAVATAAEPHFTGTVTIVEPDGALLGGESDRSTVARWVTEVSWPFLAKPLRVVA